MATPKEKNFTKPVSAVDITTLRQVSIEIIKYFREGGAEGGRVCP